MKKRFIYLFVLALLVALVSCTKPVTPTPDAAKQMVLSFGSIFTNYTGGVLNVEPGKDLRVEWKVSSSGITSPTYQITLTLKKDGTTIFTTTTSDSNGYTIPGMRFAAKGSYVLQVSGKETTQNITTDTKEFSLNVVGDLDKHNFKDAAAPEVTFWNNYGFDGIQLAADMPGDELEWFANVYGAINSPIGSKITSATLKILNSVKTEIYTVPLTLNQGQFKTLIPNATLNAVLATPDVYTLKVIATDATGHTNYRANTFTTHKVWIDNSTMYPNTGKKVFLTSDDITMNLYGVTTLETTPVITLKRVDTNATVVSTLTTNRQSIQLGALTEGAYNLTVSTNDDYLTYSLLVSAGTNGITFGSNVDSGTTSYTGDSYVTWKVGNSSTKAMSKLFYRESTHSRQMNYVPFKSMTASIASGAAGTINSMSFLRNDLRVKLGIFGKFADGTFSGYAEQYFIYKGPSDEYLNVSSNKMVVSPGETVTIDVELKNIKDFGGLTTDLQILNLSGKDITTNVAFPAITDTAMNKKELNYSKSVLINGGSPAVPNKKIVSISKGIVNNGAKRAYTAHGNVAQITFTVPVDFAGGLYGYKLANTIVRDFNNNTKGEVRDDNTTHYIYVE